MSGDSARVAYPLFQGEDGGSNPTSPLQFNIYEISVERAVELNKQWHSRLPIIGPSNIIRNADYICFGAEFEGKVYACAIWSSPSALFFNGKNYLELRRMAISAEAPKNTASRMISVMTKTIRRVKPHIVKLISYQDTEVHAGTIYRASGWMVGVNKNPPRETRWGTGNDVERNKGQHDCVSRVPKIRWEKDLR